MLIYSIVSETCKCQKDLFANWHIRAPYTELVAKKDLRGVFPDLIESIILEVCGSCKLYDQSIFHMYRSATGLPNNKESEQQLKNGVNDLVDVSFPIYAYKDRTEIIPGTSVVQIISSPGCSLIVRDETKIAGVVEKMVIGILKVWPLLLVSYSIATMFGILVWFTVGFQCYLVTDTI